MSHSDDALLSVQGLEVTFKKGRHGVQAVSGVSFDVFEGETLGLVGESGCGKTTTGRSIMQLVTPTGGRVVFDGQELTGLRRKDLRRARTGMQMVFQDPISSLNPRRKVFDIVAEPLDIWGTQTGAQRTSTVRTMLDAVGLDPDAVSDRYARECSGGQCQRVSIARSLVMRPKLLICDEIVSALDVSVQAQILNLLEDLKAQYNLTVVFIAHDLAVVKNVSDRVAVMYLGRLCEVAPADDLYSSPAHPYTADLLSAALDASPISTRERIVLTGEPPSAIDPPSGCRFRTRCPSAQRACAEGAPALIEIAPRHSVACHFPLTRSGEGTRSST